MEIFFFRKAFLVILVFIWIAAPHPAQTSLLPEGLIVLDVFEPGPGRAVGRFTQVDGEVVVIHKDGEKGFRVAPGIDLYEQDTVVTLDDGHAAFCLRDGSFITLAPETIMVIVKSDYVPEKNIRSTFVNMVSGKSRSVVQPLVESRRSEFTLKTKTAVAGVRGSDFIIYATDSVTEITALVDTHLEVSGLAALDADPLSLRDFEQTRVFYGMQPEAARKLSAEEIEQLMRAFRFQPLPPTSVVDAHDVPVVVPHDELVHPGAGRFFPDTMRHPILTDGIRRNDFVSPAEKASNISNAIVHQQFEDALKAPLPDFPEKPRE